MKKQILISVMSVCYVYGFGQYSPDSIIKTFFEEYSKNPGNAIENIYSTNPWNARIKDGIESMKKEVNGYTVDYVGKYYGYELITKKHFSENFILYSYMVKYDRQPMRFIFKIYKPNDKWHLYAFTIDTDLDDEIMEAAKLYYLNLEQDK